uniref:Uncharacterized protein n=1 Tax=Faxonius propinquus nudivirus TaxID=3139431 RepID=A0AAU8GD38_9VIRU
MGRQTSNIIKIEPQQKNVIIDNEYIDSFLYLPKDFFRRKFLCTTNSIIEYTTQQNGYLAIEYIYNFKKNIVKINEIKIFTNIKRLTFYKFNSIMKHCIYMNVINFFKYINNQKSIIITESRTEPNMFYKLLYSLVDKSFTEKYKNEILISMKENNINYPKFAVLTSTNFQKTIKKFLQEKNFYIPTVRTFKLLENIPTIRINIFELSTLNENKLILEWGDYITLHSFLTKYKCTLCK